MWIVITRIDQYDTLVRKFDSRKEAIEYINGYNDVQDKILAEVKPFRVKIDNGVVIAY